MDNDQRDRREPPPEADEAPDETLAQGSDEGLTSDPAADPAEEPRVSAADIESWPSQDVAAPHVPTEPPAPDAGAVEAWPTEPPAAGSAPPDAWPTEPPEMGDEPILPPEPTAPPTGEVEAYPAPGAWSQTTEPESDEPAPAATSEQEPEPGPFATPMEEPEPDRITATVDEAEPEAADAAVPGGATAESTLCPRCGTENQAGLSFCRSCGQRLVAAGVATTVERPAAPEGTMACTRCGTHNRAGVAFCQNCGANLRGTSAGYVPPTVADEAGRPAAAPAARAGAVLGPVVLLIGIIGIVTAYLLPFAYGTGSLLDRALGSGGYGVSFWTAYPDGGLADQAYFGLAAAAPILGAILVLLAVAGLVRARPGAVQMAGLVIALLWSVGLVVLFAVVELAGNWDGDLVGLLRLLTPAGIIFLLASLIILIGALTRFGRS